MPRRPSFYWTWLHRASAAIFLLLVWLGHFDWFPYFKGSAVSTKLFGVVFFTDPLAALEVIVASFRFNATLLIAAAILIALYAFLGRAFCAWVCPLGLMLELNAELRSWLNRFLRRHKRHLLALSIPRNTKYVLLFLALLLSLVSRLPVFQLLSPINIFTRAILFGADASLVIVAAIVLLEYAAPRAWCISLCPLGAFYSLLGRWSPWRIQIDQEREKGGTMCGLCAHHCPLQIQVLEDHVKQGKTDVDDPECMRCGMCLDGCPRESLSLGIRGQVFFRRRAGCS
jgi:ferredoxin-type protein NapH